MKPPVANIVGGETFGISEQADDNATSLQDGLEASAREGKALLLPPGLFKFRRTVILPDGATLIGAGPNRTRLEKCFATTGSGAFLQPKDVSRGAAEIRLAHFEIGAASYLIEGQRSNKLLWAAGKNWQIEDIAFRTWSGWALTVGGEAIRVMNVKFSDPLLVAHGLADENGTDGLHIAYGRDIHVRGVRGLAADDLVAVAPPLSGPVADRDIFDVTIEDVEGASEAARLCLVGIWNPRLTANVGNVTLRNVRGSAGGNGGVVLIASMAEQAGGCRNIRLENFQIDCRSCGEKSDGLRLRGGGQLENISIHRGAITNVSGSVSGVHTIGRFSGLDLSDVNIDMSHSTGSGLLITTPSGARGLRARSLIVHCGSGPGLSVPGAQSIIEDADVELEVHETTSKETFLVLRGMRNSRVRAMRHSLDGASSAMTLRGLSEDDSVETSGTVDVRQGQNDG